MALRNEIGMQASTFVKSSFSFANADNVKTRLLQAFIWAPMFGDKKFVLTEPPGYFEPPPKKSKNWTAPFFKTVKLIANEIVETMTATVRQEECLNNDAWLNEKLLRQSFCFTEYCMNVYVYAQRTLVFSISVSHLRMLCIFVEMDNFHSALLAFLSLISFEWMENFEMLRLLLHCVPNYILQPNVMVRFLRCYAEICSPSLFESY